MANIRCTSLDLFRVFISPILEIVKFYFTYVRFPEDIRLTYTYKNIMSVITKTKFYIIFKKTIKKALLLTVTIIMYIYYYLIVLLYKLEVELQTNYKFISSLEFYTNLLQDIGTSKIHLFLELFNVFKCTQILIFGSFSILIYLTLGNRKVEKMLTLYIKKQF